MSSIVVGNAVCVPQHHRGADERPAEPEMGEQPELPRGAQCNDEGPLK